MKKQCLQRMEVNWSENESQEKHRAGIMRMVPRDVRRAVRRSHKGLGHPSRDTRLKVLKISGAAPEAIK